MDPACTPGGGRPHDACPVCALPPEMLEHLLWFVSLPDLARVAAACTALRDAAAAELRGERDARHELWSGAAACHPGVLTLRGAATACRRWGLVHERPFGAVLARARRQLVVRFPTETDAVVSSRELLALSPENAWFAERAAPVRAACGRARDDGPLPVLMPGEAVCLPDIGLRVPVDITRRAAFQWRSPARDADHTMSLELEFDVGASGGVDRVVRLGVRVPCDPASAAVLGRLVGAENPRPSDDPEYRDALARYAASVERAWGAPPGSIRTSSWPHITVTPYWRLGAAALKAASRYYAAAGLPITTVGLWWRIRLPPREAATT